jgi:hypothetical protein
MASDINTIVLKGMGHHDEGIAGSVIKPGCAVELAAAGDYDEQIVAFAEALKGGLKIAKEDALQGKTITQAYAAGDVVFFYSPLPGDHVHVLVKSGEDIDIGDNLRVEGTTSGLFIESGGTDTKYQLEALEDSGGALGANGFIKCRVLAT